MGSMSLLMDTDSYVQRYIRILAPEDLLNINSHNCCMHLKIKNYRAEVKWVSRGCLKLEVTSFPLMPKYA